MGAYIICVFPSGRIIDRTILGLERVSALADEFPTLIYFLSEENLA